MKIDSWRVPPGEYRCASCGVAVRWPDTLIVFGFRSMITGKYALEARVCTECAYAATPGGSRDRLPEICPPRVIGLAQRAALVGRLRGVMVPEGREAERLELLADLAERGWL